MSLENSNAVAVERRMDLASLFCMIGRHGPAVIVAVLAMVSLLAGFIIYRTVRGKRRKATAADGDGKPPRAERDASVIQPNTGEDHSPVRATEVCDEDSPEVKENVSLSDHNMRHRRAAAAVAPAVAPAEKASSHTIPKDDTREVEIRNTSSDERLEMSVVDDSYKEEEIQAKEADQRCQSDTDNEAECHHTEIDEVTEDDARGIQDGNDSLKDLIMDENSREDKVYKADCQDGEHMITDEMVSEEKTRQKQETSDDGLQGNITVIETNSVGSVSEEPVVLMEDEPVCTISNVKEEESEPQDPDGVVGDNCHTAKEQMKTECKEAEEECEDYQPNPQQAVIQPSALEQKINLPSTEQDRNDHVMDDVTPPTESGDSVQCSGPTDTESEEVTDENNVDNLSAEDTHSPQFKERDAEVEQKEEIITYSQEDGALFGNDNQVTEKNLAKDDIMTCTEKFESSVESSPVVLTKAETNDSSLSDVTAEKKAQISDIVDCSDLSSGLQQSLEEYEHTPSLGEDTTSPTLESVMLSDDTEEKETDPSAVLAGPNIAAGDGGNVESFVMSEEEYPSQESSCYREQQSVEMINVSDQKSDFAEANAAENIISSESLRETNCPLVLMTNQDQPDEQMGHDSFDLVTPSAFEASAYNVHPTAPLPAEDTSLPNVLSSTQNQKIDFQEESESFGETSASDAPVGNTSLTALSISSSQDQLSVDLKNTFEKTNIDSDTPASDKASLPAAAAPKEIWQCDMFSSSQDQLSDQAKNTEDFSEVSRSSLDMTSGLSPSTFSICMPSFEHSDLGYSDLSPLDIGKESGISSMAVSPDLQDSGFDVIENIVEVDQLSAAQTQSKESYLTDDITVSYKYNGNTAGMVFGPYPTHQLHPPHTEQTDWIGYESFAANEDTFGHEIEDSYHREMNQFMAQIVDSITSLADELTEETDRKVTISVEEKKEEKERKTEVSVGKKAETKAEGEEEAVEFEKNEISIMEATMDNNEWITDSNYQVLPWMNISSPSVDQKHNKDNQPCSEKCASVTDGSCVDVPEDLTATEVKATSSLSPAEENNKKVLAVQPMPQNVNVTFRVHYFTQSPYQTVAVTGDQQELGNWKEFISLERAKDGHWTTVVSLPAESHVEWKFLLLDKGEVCRWEECGNRLLQTGSGDDLLVHKWWGTL